MQNYLLRFETKKQKTKRIPFCYIRRSQELESYSFDDDVRGTIIKRTSDGYILELSENLYAILPFNEIPKLFRCKIGDIVESTIFDFNYEKAFVYVSIDKFLDKKWIKLKKNVDEFIIPNETELNAKVVFIERGLATLSFKEEWGSFYGYIKNEDLAWEKVQSAADIVFLG